MLVLSSTDSLRMVTSSANAVDAFAAFADNTSSSFLPSGQATTVSAAATTTIVNAPAASTQRNISFVSVRARGGANVITLQFFNGAAFEIVSVSLASGERLEYENGRGFSVYDTNGATKTLTSASLALTQIRVNGTNQTFRAAFNTVDTTSVTWTGTDDGINVETELRASVGQLGVLLRAPQIVLATNAAFAHPTGTRVLVVEGVGGGGGGGGAAATAGACGSGGNSGNWGKKAFTSISGTSNITIGAAGTTGSAAAGGNGGNSSFVHNGVTLTLPGGIGGTLLAGAATIAQAVENAANAASTGADIGIVGQRGEASNRLVAAATCAQGGNGGSNPLGSGGRGRRVANSAGGAATGFGAGGGGAAAVTAAAQTGGAPTAGAFIIWEFGG